MLNITFSTGFFLIACIVATAALFITFGAQFLKDIKGMEESVSAVTSKQVTHYLIDEGYVVCNITPVKNSSKWLAFLIKNGEYKIATVFTNGETIQGHQDSLV
ncbi:MAG: hypothetical protein M3R27_12875 [Bacteroidota bacterium]|nr:hypothetical protein [Bacteroidota bacterium]